VLPAFEGKGIGRALLGPRVGALSAGDFPVFLHTQPDSLRAIKLYSDFGFRFLTAPRVGARANGLFDCLPFFARRMPEAVFTGLKTIAAPRFFLDAVNSSPVSEFLDLPMGTNWEERRRALSSGPPAKKPEAPWNPHMKKMRVGALISGSYQVKISMIPIAPDKTQKCMRSIVQAICVRDCRANHLLCTQATKMIPSYPWLHKNAPLGPFVRQSRIEPAVAPSAFE
jgi:hypothetical protein